eukprot:gb/GFBE01052734.1/.p1 GENE.gb/GFBE01052734.1/~~gb/GFBE01052734.1/.p1  ORF type:complete len:150 (+),score=38.39 gb/GFBE01052734.1/:1-450(+)
MIACALWLRAFSAHCTPRLWRLAPASVVAIIMSLASESSAAPVFAEPVKPAQKRPAPSTETEVSAPPAKRARTGPIGRVLDSISAWFVQKLSDGAEAAAKTSMPNFSADAFAAAEAKAKALDPEYKAADEAAKMPEDQDEDEDEDDEDA